MFITENQRFEAADRDSGNLEQGARLYALQGCLMLVDGQDSAHFLDPGTGDIVPGPKRVGAVATAACPDGFVDLFVDVQAPSASLSASARCHPSDHEPPSILESRLR